jgi:hypothetical protein
VPVVLYECETFSLIFRKEQRVRVFENRMLRKIFVSVGDEVTVEGRRLHVQELNELKSSPKYYSSDKINKNKMGGACSEYREK